MGGNLFGMAPPADRRYFATLYGDFARQPVASP
jgi:hypothetical protein